MDLFLPADENLEFLMSSADCLLSVDCLLGQILFRADGHLENFPSCCLSEYFISGFYSYVPHEGRWPSHSRRGVSLHQRGRVGIGGEGVLGRIRRDRACAYARARYLP